MRNRVPPRNYQTEVPTQLGPVDKVPLGIKMPFGRDNEFGFFGAITSTRERYHTNLKMLLMTCLLYTSPSPRDGLLSRMPSSA